jgi:chromosome segregation ATPase
LGRDLQSLEKNIIQMQNAHASEKEQILADLSRVSAQAQMFEKALGFLQHRYETRTNEMHKVRQERDKEAESKVSLEQRIERQKEDISKLKEDRMNLRRELDESREELKSGGGTLAELETAREEIRRLTKEVASLERKADYERNQAEYTREQYQNASNAAAQSGNELRQLRTENENLTLKVNANAAQLRELNLKNDSDIHLARITELELTIVARDEFLHRKEEELRDIRKNRPSTRSTSTQPRSPKITASSRPTSPGVGHNGNGNGNGLAGRGTSALRFSEMQF